MIIVWWICGNSEEFIEKNMQLLMFKIRMSENLSIDMIHCVFRFEIE